MKQVPKELSRIFGAEITIRNPRLKASERNQAWYTLVDEYVETPPMTAFKKGGNKRAGDETSYEYEMLDSRIASGHMEFVVSGSPEVSTESYVMYEGLPRAVKSVRRVAEIGDVVIMTHIYVDL